MYAHRPSVEVSGATLEISVNGCVQQAVLRRIYPQFDLDWHDLITNGDTCGLRQCPPGEEVDIAQLIVVLEARIHYTESELPADHWLIQLRNALLKAAVFILEIAVASSIENQPSQHKLALPDMWGASGKRKLNRSRLGKMRLLRIVSKRGAPNNAVLNAVADGNKGLGSHFGI